MTNIFGFKLSQELILEIAEWRTRLIPQIKDYRHRVLEPHIAEFLEDFVWSSDGGEHIAMFSPISNDDWKLKLSFIRYMHYPPVYFEMAGNIEVVTETLDSYISDMSSELNRTRSILSNIMITDVIYEQMENLGWKLEDARKYEYNLHPSGLGTSGGIRLLGETEWRMMKYPEDYDF
jgi:hypothetical protein